jgi:hypothetical protein
MLVDWVGRRTLFIISNSGMLLGTLKARNSATVY